MEQAQSSGSLACVGVGMTLGAHLTPRARSFIEQADVVFVAVSHALVEGWVGRMNKDVRSLQSLYADGRPRLRTYRAMAEAMLAEVRAGKRVCGVFYGHPGVFAWAPHKAIERARQEGFAAHMEPGVSAADCLYADLGIDPGARGCQHFEASQFLAYRRRFDPSAWLILWQVGVVGDRGSRRTATGAAYRQLLVEVLAADYRPAHEVIVYRAATLPPGRARVERVPLARLPALELTMEDTLAIPPAAPLEPDPQMARRLADLEAAERG